MLLDGHRVAPNNQDGSVNIDVLPQMLVERVDIVTGGASAVYGSDAVAGVVNYVLDKDFTGLSVKSDYGQSKYSDGDEYQFGAAWGTSLFSDRGHFEVAARMRHQDMIPMKDRPYGEEWPGLVADRQRFADQSLQEHALLARVQQRPAAATSQCGTGLRASTTTPSMRMARWSRWLTARRPAAAASNRAAIGAYIKYGTFRSEVEMKDVFARFSLDLGESANWYVQGSWAQAENASDWIQWVVSPNAGRPNTLFANNPFLNADTQRQLGASIVCADS